MLDAEPAQPRPSATTQQPTPQSAIVDPTTLLETLAAATWQRLADGDRLGVRQSETTITDYLLLELARLGRPSIHLLKTPQDKENAQGTDWEWWIGTPVHGWFRYAVQAKLLNLRSERYDQLGHAVAGRLQLDILRQYATINHAIPLYCLYNHVTKPDYYAYWHCHRTIDPLQLGCTIAPLRVVAEGLAVRGGRGFDSIHRRHKVLPWRCLVRCPAFVGIFSRDPVPRPSAMLREAAVFFGVEPVLYSSLPAGFRLANDDGSQSTENEVNGPSPRPSIRQLETLDPQFYSADTEFLPRRIVVMDLTDSPNLL
jgi:hypothetical protein